MEDVLTDTAFTILSYKDIEEKEKLKKQISRELTSVSSDFSRFYSDEQVSVLETDTSLEVSLYCKSTLIEKIELSEYYNCITIFDEHFNEYLINRDEISSVVYSEFLGKPLAKFCTRNNVFVCSSFRSRNQLEFYLFHSTINFEYQL